jgi:hypothetical protein
MKTSTIVGVAAALVVAGGAWYWLGSTSVTPVQTTVDYQNAPFTIEGQSVTLVDGRAETPAAPGSAEMVITDYFGNEATGDLNGDGIADVAFIVSQDPGGTGTFYYVVVALKTATGYQGTTAIFLGDRIAPQTTEIRDGKVVVNYADRAPGESFATAPSVGVTKYFSVENGVLIEVSAPKAVVPTKPVGDISGRQWAGETCSAQGGSWSETYGECVGIDSDVCSTIGGVWNECASACRHSPKDMVCTMQCIPLCTVQ